MKTDNSSDQSLQGLAYHARPLKSIARVILHPEIRKSYTGQCNIITDEVTNFILSYFLQDQEENLKSKSTLPKESITDQADIPLKYDLGDIIQIGWNEATIHGNGVRTKLNFFCMRLCYSCDIFIQSFYSQNIDSFLKVQQRMFDYFGEIPRRLIFDNAKVAVAEGFVLHTKDTKKKKSFFAVSQNFVMIQAIL